MGLRCIRWGTGAGFLEEATPSPSFHWMEDSPSSEEGDQKPLLSHATSVAGPGPWGETESARVAHPEIFVCWRKLAVVPPAGVRGANES